MQKISYVAEAHFVSAEGDERKKRLQALMEAYVRSAIERFAQAPGEKSADNASAAL